MVNTLERVKFIEMRVHEFAGEFPDVPTYLNVDTDLLYENDPKPFHITLLIAEEGRISTNELMYDAELVGEIERGLQACAEGIGGHTSSSDMPVAEAFWIGHVRESGKLWAKAYIPPGERREDIRRKKATHGQIGTSILGSAIRETDGKGKYWRAREFELDRLDLAPVKHQSLKKNGAFVITAETENDAIEEGNPMPDETITKKAVIAELTTGDIPQAIREQIIQEAKVVADAGRVAELESELAKKDAEIQELASWREIVGEIRTTLGAKDDADTLAVVSEMHRQMTAIAETMGLPYAGISVSVHEMHEKIGEFEKAEFVRQVGETVAELTNWNATSDKGKSKLASLRGMMEKRIVSELGAERDPEKVKETAQTIYDSEFQDIAESVRDSLAGPAGFVSGKNDGKSSGWKPTEDVDSARSRTGI